MSKLSEDQIADMSMDEQKSDIADESIEPKDIPISEMTPEEKSAKYQETFNLFDNKGDGKIFTHQLGDVLRAMGQNPTEAEVKKCGIQKDQDIRISFEQFLPMLSTISKNKDKSSLEDYIEGFRVFDKEQNGFIGSAELRHLLTSLGEKLSDEEVNELFQGQEDAQGNVNYEEFVKSVVNA